jgi:hypothetical protein
MYDNFKWVDTSRFLWSDAYGTGAANLRIPLGLPFHLGLSMLQFLGFSPVQKQAVLFLSTMASSTVFMYYLASLLLTGKERRLGSVLAGLLYLLNTYQMLAWNRQVLTYVVLPALPLVLAMFIKGLRRNRNFRIALLTSIILLVYSQVFVIMPLNIAFLFITYFVFHILTNRKKANVAHAGKLLATIGLLSLALSVWWILPVSSGLSSVVILARSPAERVDTLHYISVHLNTLFDGVRLMYLDFGFALLYPYNQIPGTEDVYYNQFLQSTLRPASPFPEDLLAAISLIVPVLAFSAVLFKPRDKHIVYFAILSLFGIFLSKGTNAPLGQINEWVFLNVPFFETARTLFQRLGALVALGYAYLIGASLASIYYRLSYSPPRFHFRNHGSGQISDILSQMRLRRRVPQIFVLSLCVLLIGPPLWPMWTGNVFSHPWVRSSEVEVPAYYTDAARWLSTQPGDWRMISLPLSWGDGARYNWTHGYTGGYPHIQIFNRPFINSRSYSVYNNAIYDVLGQFDKSFQTSQFWKLAALLNIKYIMIQGDIDYKFLGVESPDQMQFALEHVRKPGVITELPPRFAITPIAEANNTQNWSFAWAAPGSESIGLDSQDSTRNGTSVRLAGNSTNEGTFGAWLTLQSTKNWSLVPSPALELWVKSDTVGRIYIQAWDTSGGRAGWFSDSISPDETNTWKRLFLPVQALVDNQNFNQSSVQRILFALTNVGPNRHVSLKIAPPRIGNDVDLLLGGMRPQGGFVYPTNVNSNWQIVWGEPGSIRLYPDFSQGIGGSASIALVGNTTTDVYTAGSLGLKYTIPSVMRGIGWSDKAFLDVWVNSTVPGALWVELYDTKSGHRNWDGRYDVQYAIRPAEANTWKEVLLPVDIGGNTPADFNFTAVTDIVIGMQGLHPKMPFSFHVGGLRVILPTWVPSQNIHSVATYGPLKFYKLSDDSFVDHIYAVDRFNISEDIPSMLSYVDTQDFVPGKSVLFVSTQIDKQAVSDLLALNQGSLVRPQISFEKVNPTRYVARVTNASGPYFLVFSESYDSNWKAYVNGSQISDKYHYLANGYANSWYITQKGSYEIVLDFSPQKLFDYGIAISAGSFVVLVLALTVNGMHDFVRQKVFRKRL